MDHKYFERIHIIVKIWQVQTNLKFQVAYIISSYGATEKNQGKLLRILISKCKS